MADVLLQHISTGVQALNPYQPGRPIDEVKRRYGLSEVIKLASNENPLGPGPAALQALQQGAAEAGRYPDGNGFYLKQQLAALHHCHSNCITLGNGTNEVLNMLARLLLRPGVSAVYSQYAFIVYKLAVQLTGAEPIEVAASNYGHNLAAIAAAIRPDTRIVFLANPNNPTGTCFGRQAFIHFMKQVPAKVLVVLDEAYIDYVEHDDKLDGSTLVSTWPNLAVTRTFSKVHGLAGLRIGYSQTSPILADMLNRSREPFNTSLLAQSAAMAALQDKTHVQQSLALNRQGKQLLQQALAQLQLSVIESQGNFLTVAVGDGAAVAEALLQQGVIVRAVAEYGLPQHIRVSIGLPEENRRFIETLTQVLNGAE